MAERMKAQPEKFKLRKTLAEHPFGTIKRWMGYTHFTLKGLEKAWLTHQPPPRRSNDVRN
jgi:hypothetical protein